MAYNNGKRRYDPDGAMTFELAYQFLIDNASKHASFLESILPHSTYNIQGAI